MSGWFVKQNSGFSVMIGHHLSIKRPVKGQIACKSNVKFIIIIITNCSSNHHSMFNFFIVSIVTNAKF